jgi:hypothetical protein
MSVPLPDDRDVYKPYSLGQETDKESSASSMPPASWLTLRKVSSSYPSTETASQASSSDKRQSASAKNQRPRRALTAYNLFFQEQRAIMLQNGERLGFRDLARRIADLWKQLKDRSRYKRLASHEKARYQRERKTYLERERQAVEADRERLEATVDAATRSLYLASGGKAFQENVK